MQESLSLQCKEPLEIPLAGMHLEHLREEVKGLGWAVLAELSGHGVMKAQDGLEGTLKPILCHPLPSPGTFHQPRVPQASFSNPRDGAAPAFLGELCQCSAEFQEWGQPR